MTRLDILADEELLVVLRECSRDEYDVVRLECLRRGLLSRGTLMEYGTPEGSAQAHATMGHNSGGTPTSGTGGTGLSTRPIYDKIKDPQERVKLAGYHAVIAKLADSTSSSIGKNPHLPDYEVRMKNEAKAFATASNLLAGKSISRESLSSASGVLFSAKTRERQGSPAQRAINYAHKEVLKALRKTSEGCAGDEMSSDGIELNEQMLSMMTDDDLRVLRDRIVSERTKLRTQQSDMPDCERYCTPDGRQLCDDISYYDRLISGIEYAMVDRQMILS